MMGSYQKYHACIEACMRCAAICNHCSSSCTQEDDVKMMARCIQLDMECAAICTAAAQLMSLGSGQSEAICRICAQICQQCGDECAKHDKDHCKECAEMCYRCAEECRSMAGVAA